MPLESKLSVKYATKKDIFDSTNTKNFNFNYIRALKPFNENIITTSTANSSIVNSNNEIRFITINDKRNQFASSRKRNTAINEFKRIYERRLNRYDSSKANSSQETSQDLKLTNQKLLNPKWIPLHIQRNLIMLHSQSKANLSRSDTNLKQKTIKSMKFRSQNSEDNRC